MLPTVDELWPLAGQVDLVVLASPTNVHAQQAREALGRDLAVVVDKPLAVTAADARELAELAEARGVLLTVFQNRRWDLRPPDRPGRAVVRGPRRGGALRGALRAVAPGAEGALARAARPASEGGGVLMDLQSHLVDGALDLFGPAASVYAELAAMTTVGDDVTFLVLRHLSGVTSHLGATSLAGAPGPRTRLLGRDGTYLVADVDGDPTAYAAWRDADDEHRGWLVRGDESRAGAAGAGGVGRLLRGVRDALVEGSRRRSTGRRGGRGDRGARRGPAVSAARRVVVGPTLGVGPRSAPGSSRGSMRVSTAVPSGPRSTMYAAAPGRSATASTSSVPS